MTVLKKYNVATSQGETIVREMTAEEIAALPQPTSPAE